MTRTFCKRSSKWPTFKRRVYISCLAKSLTKAEGNHHADFSIGIQKMVLLSYLNLSSYLKGNKHVIIQEKRFKKHKFFVAISNANANEEIVPTRKAH